MDHILISASSAAHQTRPTVSPSARLLLYIPAAVAATTFALQEVKVQVAPHRGSPSEESWDFSNTPPVQQSLVGLHLKVKLNV